MTREISLPSLTVSMRISRFLADHGKLRIGWFRVTESRRGGLLIMPPGDGSGRFTEGHQI